MKEIKIFVENLIGLTGLTGSAVVVLRHVLLVLVAVGLAMAAGLFCRKLLVPLVLRITKKTEVAWDDVLFNERVLVSACHIVPAIVVWGLLPLVFFEFPLVFDLLKRATAIYITVMSVRTSFVFINSFKELDTDRRSSTQQYFHTFCGVLKILMVFIATIVVTAIVIDKSPATLFAGLGATSAVLMLVFKDTIEGLVAGVRLTSADMLHKGDWITVPSAGANGIVEEMTLTTVKVRNFDNTITTVSPITLVNGSFQNWKGMQQGGGRRVQRKVFYDFRSVRPVDDAIKRTLVERRYFTTDEMHGSVVNITLYRLYVEKYLRSRVDVNTDMTLMVRQLEATQCGLPLEFYFFLRQKAWVNYEHQLATIMEHIYAVTPAFGLQIYQQYPDQ